MAKEDAMVDRALAYIGTALALAAAVNIGVVAPASAAPVCETWFYPTEDFGFEQDNGIVGRLTIRGDTFLGPASHTVSGKSDVTGGSVTGDVRGRRVDFFVDWHNGVTNHYYGTIADDGTASGYSLNNRVQKNSWHALATFYCPPPSFGDPFEPPPGVQGPFDATAPFEPPPGVQGPVDATASFEPPAGVQLP